MISGTKRKKEGKGREGKGREGKGREGKGREGKGREGKGREGKGREGKGREGRTRRQKHVPFHKSHAQDLFVIRGRGNPSLRFCGELGPHLTQVQNVAGSFGQRVWEGRPSKEKTRVSFTRHAWMHALARILKRRDVSGRIGARNGKGCNHSLCDTPARLL